MDTSENNKPQEKQYSKSFVITQSNSKDFRRDVCKRPLSRGNPTHEKPILPYYRILVNLNPSSIQKNTTP